MTLFANPADFKVWGNVTALVNPLQLIVARYCYDSFGNTLSPSGPLAALNTRRFSSQEYHARSGLYYFGRRFYDPSLQRWLNRDPIAEAGGRNLYAYVLNNPVSLADYLELCDTDWDRFLKWLEGDAKAVGGWAGDQVIDFSSSIQGAGEELASTGFDVFGDCKRVGSEWPLAVTMQLEKCHRSGTDWW